MQVSVDMKIAALIAKHKASKHYYHVFTKDIYKYIWNKLGFIYMQKSNSPAKEEAKWKDNQLVKFNVLVKQNNGWI